MISVQNATFSTVSDQSFNFSFYLSTRTRSRWGFIANPPCLSFLPPSTPQVQEWWQNENSGQYVLYLLFVRTHTKFGIKIFEIDCNWNLTIFDLLRSPQGHQFDCRVKILLAFCSNHHLSQFDMPHDHIRFLGPPGHPGAPKSRPWGMTQASERILFDVSYL